MPKPRPSVTKRQREQTRRDRQAAKAERRAQRKTERSDNGEISDETIKQQSE
jgi:hypothetical protein